MRGTVEPAVRLLLDYHSTGFDTIYTLTDEQDTDPPGFTAAWVAAYQARLPDYDVRTDPSHTVDRPTSTGGGSVRGTPRSNINTGRGRPGNTATGRVSGILSPKEETQ